MFFEDGWVDGGDGGVVVADTCVGDDEVEFLDAVF